jgi:large subunit ribosomal protein L18
MANRSRADIRRSVHRRIRKKVHGTADRPRLAVFRSVNHIYAQVIDDVKGETLVAASTVDKGFKGKSGGNIEAAIAVGKTIAERSINAGIENVVYDRGGYVYHGRVKALLDATREAGLNKNGSVDVKSDKDDAPKVEKKAEKPKKVEKKTTKKKSEDKKSEEKVEDKKKETPKKEKKAKEKKAEEKVEEESAKAKEDSKAEEEE